MTGRWRTHRVRKTWVAMAGVIALSVLSACSSSSHGKTQPVPAGATPKASPSAAVNALLSAEAQGNHDGSFLLLDAPARAIYKDAADWKRRRAELPAITSFAVTASSGNHAVALVGHQPGIDPFIGLSPAQERQTWTARAVKGGWLLDGDPTFDPVLPPDSKAAPVVKAWADAVQHCDQTAARKLQLTNDLYGNADPAATLCHSTGAVNTGAVGRLSAGPESADLVAQYTADSLQWIRTVAITGPTRGFRVVVAPFGDQWRVIGLAS
jgi:hypothetical protein